VSGEHHHRSESFLVQEGSSPRERGALAQRGILALAERIIPA